jgi:L-fucose mutarotase/ribose pyranase (RbsD/FucU family)
LNNDSEHSSSGDNTSRVIKWDGALIVVKRYSLITIFEMDTVWSFLWMIMVNLTVADTRIQKQVLVKIKNVLDVEKISSLMKTICQFQGNMFP